MNLERLHAILRETTHQFRKGEIYEGSPHLIEQAKNQEELSGGGVLHVFAMPHFNDAPPGLELIDLVFIKVGVNRELALQHKDELIEILNAYPHPDRLRGGPSYIEVGAEIGDQGAAFQLFALGKVLKLWDIITPYLFHFAGRTAYEMAGKGFIMITGYNPMEIKS